MATTGFIKNFVVKNGITTGNITLDASSGNITGTNLSVTGLSELGAIANVFITGGSNGQAIITDGAGNLVFGNVSVAADPAPMPTYIAVGDEITISANYQGLFGYPITIDGTMTVDGVLVDVNDSGGGGTPGGSTTELQYNNAGSFGGISTATYASGVLTLGSNAQVKITGGSSGQLLSTDGAGNLSWSTAASAVTITVDNFTGNGVQTVFTLSVTPTDISETSVNYNGATVLRSAYTLAGANITFSSAPANGSLIEITTTSLVSGGGGGGTSPGGSNTQIQFNDAGSFAGNSGFTFNKTTGVFSAPSIVVTGNITPSANVTYSLGNNTNRFNNLYLAGNTIDLGGAIISANATAILFTNPQGGTFAVAGNSTSSDSNLGNVATANYFVGNGNGLANIQAANVSGTVTYATYAVTASTANSVAVANVAGIGNISTVNIDGNASNVLYGNGAFATAPGGGGGTYGNSNVATFLASYGSNTITTTGNISVGNIGATSGSFSANLNMTGQWINNVGYPNLSTDAASKQYVDTLVSTGISYHTPVNVATTTTLATATGGTTTYNSPNGAANGVGAYISTTGTYLNIDGANVQTVGTRILVKDEANATWNGVYTYANTTAIVRSTDTDTYGIDLNQTEHLGINDYFFTLGGVVNEGAAFIVSAPVGEITFGTSNIVFSTFSTSQVYDAGTGINITGTTISANASQTQITAVGTLSSLSVSGSTTLTGNLTVTGTIVPRVVAITDGVSVTMNGDTTDLATQTNTQAVGTLTVNAVTGTLVDGQKIIFRLKSTNVQTFSWNAVFQGSTDTPLPTTSSGSNQYDYMGFIYNSDAAKWQFMAKNFGF